MWQLSWQVTSGTVCGLGVLRGIDVEITDRFIRDSLCSALAQALPSVLLGCNVSNLSLLMVLSTRGLPQLALRTESERFWDIARERDQFLNARERKRGRKRTTKSEGARV